MFGQLLADTNPGVKPTWDALPPGVKDFFVDVVGTLMNVGILSAVAVAIIGAIVWGFGSTSNRPGVGSVGVKVLVIAVCVAIVCAGANALIGFFAGVGTTILS